MNDFFATNINILDYRSNIPDFPEKFGNRIYLSFTKKFDYAYESPFSIKYVDHGSTFYKVNGVFTKSTNIRRLLSMTKAMYARVWE